MDAADACAEFLAHLNADRWMDAATMVEPAEREAFRDRMLALLMALVTRGPIIAMAPDEPPPLPPVTPEQLARHAATAAPVYLETITFGDLAQLDATSFLAYHWSDVFGNDRNRGRGVCQERREVKGRGTVDGERVAVPYVTIPPPLMGGPCPHLLHVRRSDDRWHVALNDDLTSWRLLR